MGRRRTFVRAGHGKGKGTPHVEIPTDGMPKPVPAISTAPAVPLVFRKDGRIADAETARELGRRGGLAKAQRLRLVDSLGLAKLAEDAAFKAYRDAAELFVSAHLAELAKLAGGVVGTGPSTMVASAALQLAGSRFCFDKFAASADREWLKLGSQLGNDSRQNLLAAYSHAALEAEAREHVDGEDPLAKAKAKAAEKA